MKIALVGNPNVGKTTLFNQLTGLRQKTGNFPGVTVEKKSGLWSINKANTVKVIDLPGTYSLYPKTDDEKIVFDFLINNQKEQLPACVVILVDQSNLRRNLLLCKQVLDLGLPCVVALNLVDEAERKGKKYDLSILRKFLNCPVVQINARKGKGLEELGSEVLEAASQAAIQTPYKTTLSSIFNESDETQQLELQKQDVIARYQVIDEMLNSAKHAFVVKKSQKRHFIDKLVMHPVGGYLTFLSVLFVIFQLVYQFATYPMDWIDLSISELASYLNTHLPTGPLNDLVTEGIIPGLGGVVIFIPQIAFLFFMLALLEESGYISRVMFLIDPVMRKFGLSGRSVIPLVSAAACAIPAIMSARTIESSKERIITILVSPLVSCSARLPVYAILIALLVPADASYGIFNSQGLLLFGMYLLGIVAALGAAIVFKFFIKEQRKSYFVMELPEYRMPPFKNLALHALDKSKSFVWEAGKIILSISILLWFLASYGPGEKFNQVEDEVRNTYANMSEEEQENQIKSLKLEYSYAGIIGKTIEPVIRPLGYDWKIGIALITSFAAREVFVGTISTIFALGDEEDNLTIKERLAKAKDPITGTYLFTTASVTSLLIFYAFAMQCMSTLAVTKKETNSWKWPTLQLIYMTVLAYGGAWIAFTLLS